MIIYGTQATTLQEVDLIQDKCSHCEQQGTLQLSVLARYAHLYFIPFFPVRKAVITQCQHCRQVLVENQMTDDLKEQALRMKTETSYPIWFFSGLGVIAFLIAMVFILNEQDRREEIRFVNEPRTGDVYEFKTERGGYSSMRVSHLTTDMVYFQLNIFEVDKQTAIDQIKKEANYSLDETGISPTQLRQMLDNKQVVNIER